MPKKLNPWSLLSALPIILELIDVVMRLVKALGVPVEEQPAAAAESLGASVESLDGGFAVGAPEPPAEEFLPLKSIYLFPETTGTHFDKNARFRKDWADPDAEADEDGMVVYERTFRGLDGNGNPIFKPLVLTVEEARQTNSPQADSGTVDNRPYRPFPCRELFWWEKIELAPGGLGGTYRIRNTAYKPPANEPTEFTEGDRTMIREIHAAIVGRK